MAVVVEITPLDPASGARKPLRFADADDARVTGLNDLIWWPGVIASPTLRMDGWDGDFTGAANAASAAVQIDPVALRKYDAASPAYRWAGAALKVWQGRAGDDWSAWKPLFVGLVEDYGTDEAGRYSFSAQVDGEPFEADVLSTPYAGTGGLESNANLKDKPKPALFGRARNVEPVQIDATNNVYQVHGYGPIQAVTAVYERAADLVANGGVNVGDFASYAALVAATIAEGSFGTCLAQGLFRLGATPAGLVTADVDGDCTGGFSRSTAAVIARLAAVAGVPTERINETSLAALPAYPVNLYLTGSTKLIEIVRALAQACNAQAVISWTGQLQVVRFGGIPPSAVTLDTQGRQRPPVLANQEARVSPPYWRIEMRGARCWRPQSSDEIATAAPLIEVGTYSPTETYREGNIVSLPDGSRWLYIATDPSSGVAPVEGATWTSLSGPISQDWPDVTDSAGTKPADNADVTGDNTSKDTKAVGGVPAADITGGLLKLPAVERATIDQAAVQRQATSDRAKLAEALLRLTTEANRTRTVLRDAGVVVDPATGSVRIYGVDEALDRTSRVEIGLDAATAAISLRATAQYVQEQIALAVLDPSQAAQLQPLVTRLNDAEVSINGLLASVALKATSTALSALSGEVTDLSVALDALTGEIALRATDTRVDGLTDRIGAAELTLSSFGDVSRFGVELRQARLAADGEAKANLLGILTADEAARRQIVAAADARQEIYAKVSGDGAAEAAARLALAARVGAAEASAVVEQKARSDGDTAVAQSVTQVSARLNVAGGAGVTVEQAIVAHANRLGEIEGTYTVKVDAGGNVVGFELIGGASGPGELGLINTDLRMGSGVIISKAGAYEVRRGASFGAAANLVEWFGLATVAKGSETVANSRWAMAADGKTYLGGGDLAAIASTPDQIKQLILDGSVGTANDPAAQLSAAAATFPSGGKLRITGSLTSAATSGGSGNITGAWVIRFYVDFGSGPLLIASANCSSNIANGALSDGVARLAGQLFANPGSGSCTLTATAERIGSPNSGVSTTWTGSAIVEWVNA